MKNQQIDYKNIKKLREKGSHQSLWNEVTIIDTFPVSKLAKGISTYVRF